MSKELDALIKQVEAALAADAEAKTATTEVVAEHSRSFAEADKRLTDMEAALEAEKKKTEALQRQLELQVVSQTMDEIHSFADGLIAEGKVPPALKDRFVTLLSIAANLEGDVKSYALGDAGDDAAETPFALMTSVLGALPVHSQFKSIGKSVAAATTTGRTGDVDVRRFANSTEAADEMHARIKAIQKEKNCSYLTAFETVNREAIEAQG